MIALLVGYEPYRFAQQLHQPETEAAFLACESCSGYAERSTMNMRKVKLLKKAAPMTIKPHIEWFHGSPKILTKLHTGSTVTPVRILARAFSHKPEILSIEVNENEDTGKRQYKISHNGTKYGYLHRVLVTNPETDLIQHPNSKGAPGEEMLTTNDLHLEFLEEVPLKEVYEYTENL